MYMGKCGVLRGGQLQVVSDIGREYGVEPAAKFAWVSIFTAFALLNFLVGSSLPPTVDHQLVSHFACVN